MASTKFQIAQVESGKTASISFDSNVINAAATVQGFDVSYSHDHHVRSIEVKATMNSISGKQVTVGATCEMRDDSNNKGTGVVTVLVIAECE